MLATIMTTAGRMLIVMTTMTVVIFELIVVTATVAMMAVTSTGMVLGMTVIVPCLVVRPVQCRIVQGQTIAVPVLIMPMLWLKLMRPRLRSPC